jgi:hypothetical protein
MLYIHPSLHLETRQEEMTLTDKEFIKVVEIGLKLLICIAIAADFIDHEEREGVRDQIAAMYLYPKEVLRPKL